MNFQDRVATTFVYWLTGVTGPLQYPVMDFLVARALRKTGRTPPMQAQESE